jgi:hypothetical protein
MTTKEVRAACNRFGRASLPPSESPAGEKRSTNPFGMMKKKMLIPNGSVLPFSGKGKDLGPVRPQVC